MSVIERHEVVRRGERGPAGIRAAVAARAAGPRCSSSTRRRGQADRSTASSRPSSPRASRPARQLATEEPARSSPTSQRAGAAVSSGTEVWGVQPERVLLLQPPGARGSCRRARSSWRPGRTTGLRRCRAGRCRASSPPAGVTALVKAQRVLPGQRVLLAGTGPLLLAAATALRPRRRARGRHRRGGAAHGAAGPPAPARTSWSQTLEVVTSALWRTPVWTRTGLRSNRGHRGRRARDPGAARPGRGVQSPAPTRDGRRRHRRPRLRAGSLAGAGRPRRDARRPRRGPRRMGPRRRPRAPRWRPRRPASSSRGDGAGIGGGADVAEAGRVALAGLGAALHVGEARPRPRARARAAPVLQALRRFSAFRRTLGAHARAAAGALRAGDGRHDRLPRARRSRAPRCASPSRRARRRVSEVRAVTRAGMGALSGPLLRPDRDRRLLGRWGGLAADTAGRLPPPAPRAPGAKVTGARGSRSSDGPLPTREAAPGHPAAPRRVSCRRRRASSRGVRESGHRDATVDGQRRGHPGQACPIAPRVQAPGRRPRRSDTPDPAGLRSERSAPARSDRRATTRTGAIATGGCAVSASQEPHRRRAWCHGSSACSNRSDRRDIGGCRTCRQVQNVWIRRRSPSRASAPWRPV